MLWSTMLPLEHQKGHKIWHENIQWYVSIIIIFFFLAHECVLLINTDISLTSLDWLGSPRGSKFSTPIEDMDMEELNACLKSFYTSARKQDSSFYKKTSLKSI